MIPYLPPLTSPINFALYLLSTAQVADFKQFTMIIDAQVSTGLASAALAVAITQLLASSPSRPITGHQHAERGAEILANARDILAGPKGAALTSAQLSNYWQLLIG